MVSKPKGKPAATNVGDDDALWYKDAIIYQAHPRAFYDSDGDGIGDFAGLREKMDYLQDLGVTAIWLLPFYPSPLRDDGYDIADYMDVHPSYGTLRDFTAFLKAAHDRGLRVITELVLNHTSDEHPWFKRARRSPAGSKWRDFYVWSETPDKYKSARIIFKDFEQSNWAWDPVANAYYWHRFYSHQPDLNFDNPDVARSLKQAVDFWLAMGADGLRLDAVPYLYEREGTSCENLPETHAFLKELRKHIDERFSGRMLLAEANQWPEDAAAYFGDGDECQMNFHFPLMPRLFMSVHMEDRFPIIDILEQTPAIPDNAQWAVFLRNHDELTLEMVTDEDRDYMYRVYAQDTQARINLGIRRRLAPLLGNNRRRIELMNGLLFSLPGAPIIYYGDEIGMGDNIYLGDRNGVRTPMQWSSDRNAGFSRANPQRLYLPVITDPEYNYETVNVEAQLSNPNSLLWWMKRLIALRKKHKAFGRGTIEFLYPENRKVLAFVRKFEGETLLVIANLSRFTQYAELDMSAYKGATPVELFGFTNFPRIGELPYFLTLGPHAFYWFSLQAPKVEGDGHNPTLDPTVRQLNVTTTWEEILSGRAKARLEAVLPEYMRHRRWFGGKARTIQNTTIVDVLEVPPGPTGLDSRILLVRVDYLEGEPETYQICVACEMGDKAERVLSDWPDSVIARLNFAKGGQSAVLYEATANKEFLRLLLDGIARSKRFKGKTGEIECERIDKSVRGAASSLEPSVLRGEQSNTSIAFGDRFIMKLVRKPDVGVNPDLEIGLFLTARAPHVNTPGIAGYMEYRRPRQQPMTLAIMQDHVHNEGSAWSYTVDALSTYMERVLSEKMSDTEAPEVEGKPLALASQPVPELASDMMGAYIQAAEMMGRRTGELHSALASAPDDPAFAPEAMTPFYQRSLYQSLRGLVASVYPLLKKKLRDLPEDERADAEAVITAEKTVMKRFHTVIDSKLSGMRIRTHGDFHLGQLLYTGKDFVIIDFEGEPARPLSERRLKRSPLRDVAGMLRSFHYASYSAMHSQASLGFVRPDQRDRVDGWARYWYTNASAAYLRGYLGTTKESNILPQTPEEIEVLLDAFVLEKALYEIGYELNNRPDWVRIPLAGILQMLEGEE
ncbi:MAG: maltose alpha-D-glucosyltransferase [Chloroflexota bacterium]